jgi:broad specificity phosphatase PhoE
MAYFLIRHGETSWNKDNRIQGWTDISLSELGFKQAEVLAHALKKIPVQAVYSSDLARAHQTALAYQNQNGHHIRIDQGLREIYFGSWEGKTWQEIITENKDEYGSGLYDHPDSRTHMGESMNMFKKRASESFKTIVQEHPHDHVLIFTHGGNIRMILLDLLNQEIDFKHHIPIDNASVTVIERTVDGTLKIVNQNDTSHLKTWNL